VRIDGSRIGMAMIMCSICEIDGATLGSRLDASRIDLDQAGAVLASLPVSDRVWASTAPMCRWYACTSRAWPRVQEFE
jgi:hypothetical protein